MKYILHIIFCLLITSCAQQPVMYPERVIKIDLNNDICDIGKYLSIIDTITTVQLDTVGGYIVGGVSKIIEDEGYYYIMDMKTNSVHKFDSTGIGVYTIDRVGMAKGEYIVIGDISVGDSVLSVFDKQSSKIIKYDKCTGKFSEENKIDYEITCFSEIENYTVTFNT